MCSMRQVRDRHGDRKLITDHVKDSVKSVLIFYYAEVDAGETGEMGCRQNKQGTIFVKDIKSSLKNGMIR